MGAFALLMKDFYQSDKWKHKRASILKRDNYLCVECRKYGKNTPATYVHHIQHYDERPDLALVDSNLESVCIRCHNKLHPEKAVKATHARRKTYY